MPRGTFLPFSNVNLKSPTRDLRADGSQLLKLLDEGSLSPRCLPCPVVSCSLSNQSGSHNDARVPALTVFTAHCGFMLADDVGSLAQCVWGFV